MLVRSLFTAFVLMILASVAPVSAAESFSPRVLIVATSHSTVPGHDKTTGVWLSELVDPYWVFRDAGARVDIATIRGGPPPIDPRSGKPADLPKAFRDDAEALSKVERAPAIARVDMNVYDAVFLAGGHGTMWDFVGTKALSDALSRAYQAGIVIGAVCHGPAGLLEVVDAQGRPIVEGKRVTAFTNEEEVLAGWSSSELPFSLEDRLEAKGARFDAAIVFTGNAVRDGTLITGQNPASADDAAGLVLQALRERAGAVAAN